MIIEQISQYGKNAPEVHGNYNSIATKLTITIYMASRYTTRLL
jgi:hypothetical protein